MNYLKSVQSDDRPTRFRLVTCTRCLPRSATLRVFVTNQSQTLGNIFCIHGNGTTSFVFVFVVDRSWFVVTSSSHCALRCLLLLFIIITIIIFFYYYYNWFSFYNVLSVSIAIFHFLYRLSLLFRVLHFCILFKRRAPF